MSIALQYQQQEQQQMEQFYNDIEAAKQLEEKVKISVFFLCSVILLACYYILSTKQMTNNSQLIDK